VSEQYNGRATLRRFKTFPRPLAHRLSVRRIAKDTMSAPIAREAVVVFREKHSAFCVLLGRASVQGEMEFLVESVVKTAGRWPFLAAAAVQGLVNCHDRRSSWERTSIHRIEDALSPVSMF
jgi:hypothetical protein